MIVCHCKVVRADEIRTEVRLGARSVVDVAIGCGAGTACGGCQYAVADLIEDELARAECAVGVRH